VPDPVNPCSNLAYPLVKYNFLTWYWTSELNCLFSLADAEVELDVLLFERA
jgi:hypothetical protein